MISRSISMLPPVPAPVPPPTANRISCHGGVFVVGCTWDSYGIYMGLDGINMINGKFWDYEII
jgi:hypothetical protein